MNESKYKVYYSLIVDELFTIYFNELEKDYFVFDGSGTYLMSKEQIEFNLIYIGEL